MTGGPGYQWHWLNQRSLFQNLVQGKDGGGGARGREKARKTPRGLAWVSALVQLNKMRKSSGSYKQGVLFLEHVKLIPALGSSDFDPLFVERFFPQLLVRSHRRGIFTEISVLTTLSSFLGRGRMQVWRNTDFVRESQSYWRVTLGKTLAAPPTSPSSSSSFWPPEKSDLRFPQHRPGGQGLSLHSCSQLLTEWAGPPAGTEPGRLQGFPARAYLFEAQFALPVKNGQLWSPAPLLEGNLWTTALNNIYLPQHLV